MYLMTYIDEKTGEIVYTLSVCLCRQSIFARAPFSSISFVTAELGTSHLSWKMRTRAVSNPS